MTEVEYLTLEDLLHLVRRLDIGPVRELGTSGRGGCAQSSPFGEDAYPTIHLKGAALWHSIVTNHALVDGNRRLGWLATTVFCDINKRTIEFDGGEAFQLVLAVAEGDLEVGEIAERLKLS